MTVFHTKSAQITSLDSTPIVRITRGKGGTARVVSQEAYATPTASAGIDSTLAFLRLRSNAILKTFEAKSAAQDTTGQWQFGFYYASDGSNALSVPTLLAANAIDADFVCTGAQFDPGGVASYIRVIPGGAFSIINATPALIENTAWTAAFSNSPLWEALGLTSDPGGNFDLVGTVVEAPGATTVPIFVRAEYVE